MWMEVEKVEFIEHSALSPNAVMVFLSKQRSRFLLAALIRQWHFV